MVNLFGLSQTLLVAFYLKMWDNLGTTNAERLAASFQKEKKVFIAFYSSLKTRRKFMKTKFTTHKKQLSALVCATLLGFPWGGGKCYNSRKCYTSRCSRDRRRIYLRQ